MTLETSKTLGGVGALLVVIGFLGFFGTGYAGLLALIGIILTLIAFKGMADHYNEGGIFNNALYGFIFAIIGIVVFVAALVVTAIAAFEALGVQNWHEFMMTPGKWQSLMDLNVLWKFIGGVIVSLVLLYVFIIITTLYFRKSLNTLSAKSGEKIFETAGLLWLIGALLTIILVGFIIIWIAWILIAVGFFSIKTTVAQPPVAAQPPQPPT